MSLVGQSKYGIESGDATARGQGGRQGMRPVARGLARGFAGGLASGLRTCLLRPLSLASLCLASLSLASLCLASIGLASIGLATIAGTSACAQTATSSASNPFLGSVVTGKPTTDVMSLSFDDAIRMGLEHNLGLVLQQQTQKSIEAEKLTAFNELLPNISAQAQTSVQQIDLVALGFKPALIQNFGPGLRISPIVKFDVTSAQLNLSQQLFNLSDIELYRTAREIVRGSRLDTLNARGAVVIGVGDAYLQILADSAAIDNANSLLAADKLLLKQVIDQHTAGVATKLDELRAQVQYQAQEQALIHAQTAFAKDKIALNRQIGLDPAQKIQLTDPAPYSELATLTLAQAKEIAYGSRKDYLALQARVHAAQLDRKAVRYERLPSLSFDGNYGVTGETHGLYHGTFVAAGTLKFPIFQEAKLRGEREVIDGQLSGLASQLMDLKVAIDGQIRSSLLDVQAANELVKVAGSEVDLAKEEVEQATERFQAGVDDNLRVLEAQAVLADAQSRLVSSLYQYNASKLLLARDTGIVESQYRAYLGK